MQSDFAVAEATIASIHAAYRARELSAVELVDAYLERIEAYDRSGPILNSVVVTSDQARARAEELDGEEPTGALHGIPVLLKDNINTSDLPTAYGSVAMRGYRPREDATVARRLREAGAIVLGKTTLPDWATSWFSYSSLTTETRNPYDPNRDPGGSSSGTGAAVAANLATTGLGTDCGGSVRLPALVLQPRRRAQHAGRDSTHRDVVSRDSSEGTGRADGQDRGRRPPRLQRHRRLRPGRSLQRRRDGLAAAGRIRAF